MSKLFYDNKYTVALFGLAHEPWEILWRNFPHDQNGALRKSQPHVRDWLKSDPVI